MHSPLQTITTLLLVLLLFPFTILSLSESPSTYSSTHNALQKRQWEETKFCRPSSSICYLEITLRGTNPIFRLAIPDSSPSQFDTLLEMITPVALTWAGFAWGGGMTLNPLTVAWPNGNAGAVTISSRWASGRTMPSMYSGATYKVLSSSRNATHWMTEVACTGCSKWSGGQLRPDGLNTFAWAVGRRAVAQPASASSTFYEHSNVGMFTSSLANAKNPQAAFRQYISSPPR